LLPSQPQEHALNPNSARAQGNRQGRQNLRPRKKEKLQRNKEEEGPEGGRTGVTTTTGLPTVAKLLLYCIHPIVFLTIVMIIRYLYNKTNILLFNDKYRLHVSAYQ
jgi:hypothetical protein